VSPKDYNAVAIYEAFKAINDTLLQDLRDKYRERAKKQLQKLSYQISLWSGSNTPVIIESPINDIAKGIREKAIPIVQTGSKKDVASLRQLLYDFLLYFDTGITWESIIEFGKRFSSLPTTPMEPEKPTLPLMRTLRFRYPIIVIPSWLGVFVLLFYTTGQQLGSSLGVSLIIAFAILNFIKIK